MESQPQNTLTDFGLLLFRTGLGLSVFIAHGMPKITNILNGNWDFPDPVGLGPELGLILHDSGRGRAGVLAERCLVL